MERVKTTMYLPLISVVIPTYNRKANLMKLISSLLDDEYVNKEIIVVDDHSSDGTSEDLRKTFPTVKVIRNPKERFLAGSRNVGILSSRGDFVFLIDDDNIVAEDTITELVKAMNDDKDVGVAGPLMFYYSAPNTLWCAGIKRSYWTSKTTFVGRDGTCEDLFNGVMESEDFPNAFMVRKEVFERIGLFDEETFPIHYDEADFCQRVKTGGWKITVIPTAKVWHDVPSPKRGKSIRAFHLQNKRRAYFAARNRTIFHRKYSNVMQCLVFFAIFMPLSIVFYIHRILNSNVAFLEKKELMIFYLKGIVDGLKWRIFSW